MSSEALNKDWLDPAGFKSAAARRFAEFCLQSTPAETTEKTETDDPDIYRQAVTLILERLEHRLSTRGSA